MRWIARTLVLLVALAWSLLLIAWLTLHWGILPHIQQWRGPIEERASTALGVPVRIGRIDVRSSGWVPSFELQEVSLQGPDGQPALRLPRIFAAISPRSLLSFELNFEQLLIEGAELDLRRDVSGRILVAGLDFNRPSTGNGNAGADWFFKQREFVIRGGSLRWTDEMRHAPPLVLGNVDFVVRNTLRQHTMRLDATPPAEWGDRFTVTGRFSQPLLARRGDFRRWTGSVYANLPRADVRELRQHVTLPFELSEGAGALRGWIDMANGEPTAATVDLALRDVVLRLDSTVDALAFSQIEGRLIGQRDKNGITLEAQHFGFLTGDAIRWPPGAMKLAWRQREGQPSTGGSFSADRLDIGLMAQVASRVPLGDAMRRLLDDLHAQGALSDLDAHWDGQVDAPARYRVKGRLSGLSLASKPSAEAGGIGRPGLRNADLQLDANEGGGSARIDIADGALELPGVFEEPVLPLTQLGAQLLWKIERAEGGGGARGAKSGDATAAVASPKVTVELNDARFSNADAKAELSARWSTGSGQGIAHGGRYPGTLELDGKLADGVATRIHRYLPLGLSRNTRDYVEHAVQGGKLSSASFHIKGDLWDFPFFGPRKSADGEFRIAAHAEDASFAYVPGPGGTPPPWPMLTRASADLVLERGTFDIRNGHAFIGNIEWDRVDGSIQHLDTEGVLTLDAAAHGPLTEMLRYVNVTPVGGWLGKALANSNGTGNAELKLGLGLPLEHLDNGSTAKGSITLANNDVRITPDSPMLGGAKGRVDFTHKGFNVVGATAKIYGGDASFEGGTQADGSLRFNGQGSASADGLQRASELGELSRIASAFSGQTSYRMNLGFVHDLSELSVTSNLVGLAVNLPAPVGKTADQPIAMRYQTTGEPQTVGAAPRDSLQFDLGELVHARYLRESVGDTTRVIRGGIGVMEAAPTPAAGVAANVSLKTVDVDAWQAAFDKLSGGAEPREAGPNARLNAGVNAAAGVSTGFALNAAPGSSGTSAAAGNGVSGPNSGPSAAAGYVPDTIALRVQELNAGPRKLTRLTAGVSQDDGTWRANLDADQLAGYVEYRVPNRRNVAAPAGRVYARLSRLSLPKSDADQVSTLLDSQPANVPALDVVVEDFELRGMRLGRLDVEASNRSAGPLREAPRDWQLNKFNITTPEAQFVATGLWAAAGVPALRTAATPRRMSMDFKLQTSDSGALLDRLGTSKVIRGGKGQLSGQVAWQGSPFSLDYPSLSGQINVAIDEGQFLKADPGAARLLGVLSLQSLPRRLSLDFRDVFDQGFAFDNITGDVRIAQGVAQTNNLRMRGVQAAVLMEGSADIEHETQDLRVIVVPEINAGTAALAYAVINPAIGLGAFLAQALLKKPLTAAGTREFRISGPWADPKVVTVARKLTDAVPSTDIPASSPPQKQ